MVKRLETVSKERSGFQLRVCESVLVLCQCRLNFSRPWLTVASRLHKNNLPVQLQSIGDELGQLGIFFFFGVTTSRLPANLTTNFRSVE